MVVLSEEIHREFHKQYGYLNFTPSNFYDFYKIKTGQEFVPVFFK